VNGAAADQGIRHFQDNGGHIAPGEEILVIQESVRCVLVLLVERREETAQPGGVAGEQFGRKARIGPNAGLAEQLIRGSARQQFTLRPAQGVLTRGPKHAQILNMPVFTAIGMPHRAEPKLEGHFRRPIPVQVEAKGVEPLFTKGVGRGQTRVGINGHGHDRRAGRSGEKVEVIDVDARVFLGGGGIEMV
jgi:hypothetical protein